MEDRIKQLEKEICYLTKQVADLEKRLLKFELKPNETHYHYTNCVSTKPITSEELDAHNFPIDPYNFY